MLLYCTFIKMHSFSESRNHENNSIKLLITFSKIYLKVEIFQGGGGQLPMETRYTCAPPRGNR